MQVGLIAVANNNEINEQLERDKQQRRDNAIPAQLPMQTALAAHVKSKWNIAKNAKSHVTTRLIDCLRRRKGEYSAEYLERIKATGGTDIFMQVTGAKCRSAKAWLGDLFAASGDKPYTLEPTPVNELPPEFEQTLINTAIQGALNAGVPQDEVQGFIDKHANRLKDEVNQEAEKRAESMSEIIEDKLTEGNWRHEFDEFLDDLVTYPAAIIKGPVFRVKPKLEWVQTQHGWQPNITNQICEEYRRVSPFDFFPSPSTVNIGDSYTCERIRLTANDLASMRGAPGYDAKNIAMALNDYRLGGLREWLWDDGEREQLEGRRHYLVGDNDTIDGIEFNGWVQGKMLLEWGLSEHEIPDPYAEYSISAQMIGNYIIRALVNPDPMGRPYYYKACWENVPNSFWGNALPEIISDSQDAANTAARSLVNNMAIASGPQVAVDMASLGGQEPGKMYPWRIWKYNSQKITSPNKIGIEFFMPDIRANELLSVYERFVRYADEISGLPAYAFGSDSGAGAARTASGLSMLMNAASKGIKTVVRNVDINVIEPLISSLYYIAMLDPNVDEQAKGDLKIKARGADGLVMKEASLIRQQELLAQTNNPVDLNIIGETGRLKQLKEVVQSSDHSNSGFLPTVEELEQRQAAQQQAQLEQQQLAAQQGGQPVAGQ